MISIEHAIVIDRPPDEVFDYLTAPWKMPEWQADVLEATTVGDQPIGPDTKVRVRRRFMGQIVTVTLETTEFTPGERFSFASQSGPITLTGSVAVTLHDKGTSVLFTVSGEGSGLLMLAGPLIEQIVRQETMDNAANLKRILESEQ